MAVYKAQEKKWTKDGRKWFFTANYKDLYGVRKKYHSKKYHTRIEAMEAERTFILSRDETKVDNNVTFGELYRLFYNYQKDKVKVATKKTYINRIKFFDMFMDVKIRDITSDKLEIWKQELNKKNISLKYKNDILKLFKAILNYGTKWYDYDFKHIYNKIVPFSDPDAMPKEMDYYTLDEFKKFLSVETELKYICLFKVLYYCGLRMGELRGLTWDAIDLEERQLRVNKNIVNVKSQKKSYTLTSPKTKKSIRTIPIPKHLAKNLITYKNTIEKTYHFSNKWYVFGDIDPIGDTTIRDRKKRNCKLANIKEIRIHDFRHSCVSLLINSGANITLVASYMGHSKIDETLNTYAHLYRNTLEGIVKIMDECEDEEE